MIICHTVPDIWCVTDVIVIFHFGQFFVPLPPNLTEKQKFQKREQNSWRCHHFTQAYQKP